jgi:hypothetical protein
MAAPASEMELPPDPAALIQSMRAFGYSLPTALADLIDNSISAGASQIDVELRWNGPSSTVSIIDDGCGMDGAALTQAMRLGSRSPVEARLPTDLGRFGLGLKSAAWSQARSLTVLTRAGGGPVLAARWDLDHVTRTGRWSLLGTTTQAGEAFGRRLGDFESGTVVLLERLDRLVGAAPAEDDGTRERFYTVAQAAATHLGMVFHRFLGGRAPIRLTVNEAPIEPWDPFLESHPGTQRLPDETIAGVLISPFVLPHVSKLTTEAHAGAAGTDGWNAQQGFYVYRARRLLVAGDWLGLRRMHQEEHFKLARIRVDLDNAMDSAWQIDVRKATARVPGPLQSELDRIARATRRRAAEVYRFRGKSLARSTGRDLAISFVWERVTHRGGAHVFRVNRRHPTLAALRAAGPEEARAVDRALRLVEESLPVEAIVMESREHPAEDRGAPFAGEERELASMLAESHTAMVDAGADPVVALTALADIEPFEAHPALIGALRDELAL